MSFPVGSLGGPDAFRPQQMKDMINCREIGSDLLTALTAFVSMVLAGLCPRDVAPVFFVSCLIAFDKKFAGIRPIVIAMTLRRLSVFQVCQCSRRSSPRNTLLSSSVGSGNARRL